MSETLGGFEKLLMLAILRLGANAYGAAIFEELEARTSRRVAPGAVYVTLGRLEKRGLVRARPGESTPERGGRPKKVYELQPDGLDALRGARRDWDAMAEGLGGILGVDA